MSEPLAQYRSKRDFERTPEPAATGTVKDCDHGTIVGTREEVGEAAPVGERDLGLRLWLRHRVA